MPATLMALHALTAAEYRDGRAPREDHLTTPPPLPGLGLRADALRR
jgi:hypothetical protein